MEVVLIVIGVLLAIGSFLLPEKSGKKKPDEESKIVEIPIEYVLTEENTLYVKNEIQRIHQESVEEAAEQTEDMLNKIANEKIMSISELSEQILEKITQNHKEVIFLYDLLNDKEEGIKKLLVEIDQSKNTADSILDVYGKDLEIIKEMKKLNELAKRSILHMNGIIKKEKMRQDLLQQEMPISEIPVVSEIPIVKEINPEIEEMKILTEPAELKEKIDLEEQSFHVSKQNQKEKILALHQENYSIRDIAKKLSMGQGEVKLVLDLFQGGKP